MELPALGWSTYIHITSNYDGDTLKFTIKKDFTLRLTDEAGTFDTPEIARCSPEEREWGIAARDFLNALIQKSKESIVFVPTSGRDVGDAFSIGSRIVGILFIDKKDVSEIMTEMGFNKSRTSYEEWLEIYKDKYTQWKSQNVTVNE